MECRGDDWKTEIQIKMFYEIEEKKMIDKCKRICCKIWDIIKSIFTPKKKVKD